MHGYQPLRCGPPHAPHAISLPFIRCVLLPSHSTCSVLSTSRCVFKFVHCSSSATRKSIHHPSCEWHAMLHAACVMMTS